MKPLPRIGCQPVHILLLVGALGGGFCLARSPSTPPGPKQGSAGMLRSVKVISDAEGPALEIVSSHAMNPAVESRDSPPRLIIDLPNTRTHLPRTALTIGTAQVSALRVNQSQQSPPVTRVVVDLVQPVGYSSTTDGQRLLVHLYPIAEAKATSPEPPSVPSLTRGVEPAFVPVGAATSGAVVEVGSRLAGDSSVTAGPDTTILRLAHGGEVRVCPGTTLSVTSSQNGRELMLGMSTGALEAHYTLKNSADSVLTPDFRMLLAGPGELHYAFSADMRGNTCVRALPGNAASVIVSELMGSGTYQVRPNEQVLFRSGQLSHAEATAPDNCGCPPPQIPAIRASTDPVPTVSEKDLPPSVHLAQPGDEEKSVPPAESTSGLPASETSPSPVALGVTPRDSTELPAPEPGTAHVQIEAPFVFRAADSVSPPPNVKADGVPMSRSTSQAPVLAAATPPDAEPQPEHKTVFGKVKSFFASVFH
jgi:AMIN domain